MGPSGPGPRHDAEELIRGMQATHQRASSGEGRGIRALVVTRFIPDPAIDLSQASSRKLRAMSQDAMKTHGGRRSPPGQLHLNPQKSPKRPRKTSSAGVMVFSN
jgi:hypothetical protein